jgi:CheY-like chemotaxis protein
MDDHSSQSDDSAAGHPGSTPLAARKASPLRIVVVDDLADATDALARLLAMHGYSVRTAYDGLAALAVAAEFRPHAMLLDIGLPQCDGYQVATSLRQLCQMQSLCLIAVSGYGTEAYKEQSSRAGFDFHLLKPVSFAQLSAILQRRAEWST